MYTNIDTETGITTITDILEENSALISSHFPFDLLIKVLQIMMKNNVFTFGDTYWLQMSSTATGTPTACAYATIMFGHYENKHIPTNFSNNLLYHRRYIDDVFGIWLPPAKNKLMTWNAFNNTLNGWGKLEWAIEEPSAHTAFLDLDLDITLSNSKITTKTFQKTMHLYLYILPTLAHPPSCLKGLIISELRCYWLQNNTTNFQNILTKFVERLTKRGHKLDDLIPLFLQASINLMNSQKTVKNRNSSTTNSNTLYIHWTYHPMGIKGREI
jgi:hypothetical protein